MTKTTENPQVEALFHERWQIILKRTDKMFATLMVVQWVAAIGLALWVSPHAWAGRESVIHAHVFAALFIGGAISSLPLFLVFYRPGHLYTRYVIAAAQMLWAGLLIHLTGGRIETHFHIFGSLAFLAFYRDLRILIPATVVTAADHFIRGLYWPESIYGIANPEWWRFLEHAWWVIFIDFFLITNCIQSYRDLWGLCEREVELVQAQESAVRLERLAAVGQLAASVGHELRNPLAAIRNAHVYISRQLKSDAVTGLNPRVGTFLDLMDRELDASTKIIADLLDFSRAREPARTLCPLQPLVDEAIELIPEEKKVGVTIRNEVAADLPVPAVDKDQFRQVLVNLIQNASEAVQSHNGSVAIEADGGNDRPWRIVVRDDGGGIDADALEKIFEPLFSTKTKGTGLGLAIVRSIVQRHGGDITVTSSKSNGTVFVAEIPPRPAESAKQAAA